MTKTFSANASNLIARLGNAAHHAVGVYRKGGERLADRLEQRWNAALKESAPKLKPETRKNASRAQEAFSGYYARGLALSADGAEMVIDTMVGVAVTAIGRAAASKAGARKAA
jgi:hypothetical protein